MLPDIADESQINYIDRNRLRSIKPKLIVIIDGIKLYPHSTLNRPLIQMDEDEIAVNKITKDDIITEKLYHILFYLQNTALNLSGQLKVLLRTEDKKIISYDQRIKTPDTFDNFLKMWDVFIQQGIVRMENRDTDIIKFVKSDLSNSIPPGFARHSVYIGGEVATNVSEIFKEEKQVAVYIHINPHITPTDETILKTFNISTDNLSAETAIARVVKEVEKMENIW